MPKQSKPKTTKATPRNEVQRDAAPCNTTQQPATSASEPKRETKQSIIINLLSQPDGTTLTDIIAATEWKPHSVRGHLSNLRKKQGLDIQPRFTEDGTRSYRIAPPQAAT